METRWQPIYAYRAGVLRAYLLLMECAADRQMVAYDDLACRLDQGGPNLLARPLELIARWCHNRGLPAIASLVVEKATGMAAHGFGEIRKDDIPASENGCGRLTGMEFYRIAVIVPKRQMVWNGNDRAEKEI
jgi:hypothetical protein